MDKIKAPVLKNTLLFWKDEWKNLLVLCGKLFALIFLLDLPKYWLFLNLFQAPPHAFPEPLALLGMNIIEFIRIILPILLMARADTCLMRHIILKEELNTNLWQGFSPPGVGKIIKLNILRYSLIIALPLLLSLIMTCLQLKGIVPLSAGKQIGIIMARPSIFWVGTILVIIALYAFIRLSYLLPVLAADKRKDAYTEYWRLTQGHTKSIVYLWIFAALITVVFSIISFLLCYSSAAIESLLPNNLVESSNSIANYSNGLQLSVSFMIRIIIIEIGQTLGFSLSYIFLTSALAFLYKFKEEKQAL
ncbi:hypothetical protein [Candidatus Odyssella thessalonicensis]|uniref:hypothetical protein n=1 Tax=Candidatus Odyssella thessalonicensis TaxID=84647 RepID=UPI000225C060|nr:hypothetical protein [Candidatus Odyssella thessalonicensis]